MTNATVRLAVASRLRLAREQAGLSQGQIAKLTNMHRPTVSEIEAGRRRVSAEELAEFARHYDVSIAWLVGEEGQNDPHLDRVRLAARELEKLRKEDIDRLLRLLSTLRDSGEKDR